MNKLGTKLGAVAMSAVMALSFAPSAAITSLAAGDGLTDPIADSYQTVYVCYDANSGEHLWTTEKAEADWLVNEQGWLEGNPAWKAPSIAGEPVYRLYSPSTGEHHYTANKNEATWLEGLGWNNEKVAFLTPDPEDDGATPILCYRNPNGGRGAHQYTISEEEAEFLDGIGWGEEDPRFYGYELTFDPVVEELTVSIDNTTPKVGDTIRVLIYDEDGNEINPDDVDAEIQWYADSIEITGADEAEYDVLVGDVGVKLSACVTIDGEEYWTDQTAKVEAYVFEIESAEATKVNTIEVKFKKAQDPDKTTVTLTKDGAAVDATVTWNDDKTLATITTTAKMITGKYTVTAASDVTGAEDTAVVEIVSQYVKEIVIKDDIAYTNSVGLGGFAPKELAYAYYDVLDQYGESMRASASIEWSGSAARVESDKTTGRLTFKKATVPGTPWTYNDKIYVIGVYVKEGITCQKELTVGSEQALDTIKIAGFVKKGTTELVKSLPSDFKTGTYFLAYTALDQNGEVMEPTAAWPVVGTDVTFISDNILLVKEVVAAPVGSKTVSIDGVTYACALVEPGIKVSEGGEATITAVANKTGNKTEFNVAVGEAVTLASFQLQEPAGIIADNEDIEIPFEALDINGNKITNFVNLAKQETFNTLSFSTSAGSLTLAEQDDGTAKLTYSDAGEVTPWGSAATDGIDRAVNLTAIVTGGGTSNEMIYVSDMARPDAIYEVALDDVFVEGAKLNLTSGDLDGNTLEIGSFKFLDQYGRKMPDYDGDGKLWGDDNGFFAAYATRASAGSSDFAGYAFGVRATYSGNGKLADSATSAAGLVANKAYVLGAAGVTAGTVTGQATRDLWAQSGITAAATGESLKFEIVKSKVGSTDWEAVSSAKTHTMTVVDIHQLKGFEIGALPTFYIGSYAAAGANPGTGNGVLDVSTMTADQVTMIAFDAPFAATRSTVGLNADSANDYSKTETKVTAKYNGKTVTVPAAYYTVEGSKISPISTLGDNVIGTVSGNGIHISDLYDATSAKLNAKLGKDTLTVKVYQDDDDTNLSNFAVDNTAPIVDTATIEVTFSDQKPGASVFDGLKDAYTVNPTFTALDQDLTAMNTDLVGEFNDAWKVKDQYGVKLAGESPKFRVTNIKENPDGYADNNFTVTGNSTTSVSITGAERGDTFTLEISDGSLKKEIAITVGADTLSTIVDSNNNWRDILVDPQDKNLNAGDLEEQRRASLG